MLPSCLKTFMPERLHLPAESGGADTPWQTSGFIPAYGLSLDSLQPVEAGSVDVVCWTPPCSVWAQSRVTCARTATARAVNVKRAGFFLIIGASGLRDLGRVMAAAYACARIGATERGRGRYSSFENVPCIQRVVLYAEEYDLKLNAVVQLALKEYLTQAE